MDPNKDWFRYTNDGHGNKSCTASPGCLLFLLIIAIAIPMLLLVLT